MPPKRATVMWRSRNIHQIPLEICSILDKQVLTHTVMTSLEIFKDLDRQGCVQGGDRGHQWGYVATG